MIVTKTKTNTHQSTNSSLFVMYQLSDGGEFFGENRTMDEQILSGLVDH